MDRVIRQFHEEALRSPWVKPEDHLTIESIASVYASCKLAELYFKKFGVMTNPASSQVSPRFNDLHKQYTDLQATLRTSLKSLGMSPDGRKLLREQVDSGKSTSLLETFVAAKYTVNGAIVKEPKKLPEPKVSEELHNPFLAFDVAYEEVPRGSEAKD